MADTVRVPCGCIYDLLSILVRNPRQSRGDIRIVYACHVGDGSVAKTGVYISCATDPCVTSTGYRQRTHASYDHFNTSLELVHAVSCRY